MLSSLLPTESLLLAGSSQREEFRRNFKSLSKNLAHVVISEAIKEEEEESEVETPILEESPEELNFHSQKTVFWHRAQADAYLSKFSN